jgi:transcriptional regulator with XRE-family HTH domain
MVRVSGAPERASTLPPIPPDKCAIRASRDDGARMGRTKVTREDGPVRRTPKVAAHADRQCARLSEKLGRMLKDARLALHLTQTQAAERAGLSQSTWSRLEIGSGPRVTLGTWARAAAAVNASLDAFLRTGPAADQPRDAVHLGHQELVIRTAAPGGWDPLPEHALDPDASRSRFADVLLRRMHERALVDVWDWFDDVGAAARSWPRRLNSVERQAITRMVHDDPLPRVSGAWVVRATQRNRQLVREHRHFFRALLPGPRADWLAALTRPDAPMPASPALLWVTVKGDRIYPARL